MKQSTSNPSQNGKSFIFTSLKLAGKIIFGLMLVSGVIFGLIRYRQRLYRFIRRDDWKSVNAIFVEALLDNKGDVAKSLTDRSQWKKIDDWTSHREPFNCPFSWEIDNEPAYLLTDGGGEDGIVSLSYSYQCSGERYSFRAELILQKENDGWRVVELTELCEEYGWDKSTLCK
jgi:hypothetical protein